MGEVREGEALVSLVDGDGGKVQAVDEGIGLFLMEWADGSVSVEALKDEGTQWRRSGG